MLIRKSVCCGAELPSESMSARRMAGILNLDTSWSHIGSTPRFSAAGLAQPTGLCWSAYCELGIRTQVLSLSMWASAAHGPAARWLLLRTRPGVPLGDRGTVARLAVVASATRLRGVRQTAGPRTKHRQG